MAGKWAIASEVSGGIKLLLVAARTHDTQVPFVSRNSTFFALDSVSKSVFSVEGEIRIAEIVFLPFSFSV